jgi:hypothetical protein
MRATAGLGCEQTVGVQAFNFGGDQAEQAVLHLGCSAVQRVRERNDVR